MARKAKYYAFLIVIILGLLLGTDVYAAGAQDSNPDTQLGTDYDSLPGYGAGQQIQSNNNNKQQDDDKDKVEIEDFEVNSGEENTGDGELLINPNNYKPDSTVSPQNSNKVRNIGNDIIGLLQIIGTILSVTVLIVLGIKYMLGSVEERAEYKKSMMPYLIGAIMIFGITNIVALIAGISENLVPTYDFKVTR